MKKIKRIMMLLLSVLMLLTGCGNAAGQSQKADETGEEERPISVVAILKARNSLHWHMVMEGLNQSAKKYNMNLNVLWPERETDVDTQIRMIGDAIQGQPDVIIWAPDDSENADVYAKQIREAGIHLIYLDENAEVQMDVPYVGSDNYHAGELAAESIEGFLKKGDAVAFIGGSQDQQVHYLRGSGFKEYAEKETSLQYRTLEEVPDCSIEGGKAAMKKILQENPDVKGVFCASALLAMGAQEACQSLRRTDVKLVGMDTQSDILTALKSRKIQAIISQNGYEMGSKAIDLAMKLKQGIEIPVMNYINNEVITRENVEDYLDAFVMEGRE